MRSIWVTFSKEGIHKYPAALTDPKLATGDEYDVSFLGYPHRHTFHFKVWIEVFHDDRDIEFIQFKRWLEKLYGNAELQLDYKSCEMIADDLYETINDEYPGRYIKISVAEDNENGCEMEYPTSDGFDDDGPSFEDTDAIHDVFSSLKDDNIVVKKPEGSWYEGGNPHKDDSQDNYVKGLDD
tara:strand:+ start:1676 stop:2221 length:546 start_codon:yes stop_codon:yes gene_type:complete